MGHVLEPADRVRAEKARQVAERVDQRDAGGRAVPARNAVGRLQNSGSVVRMPMVASVSATMAIAVLSCQYTDSSRPSARHGRDGNVPATFAGTVRAVRDQHHADHGAAVRNRGQQADVQRALDARLLDTRPPDRSVGGFSFRGARHV